MGSQKVGHGWVTKHVLKAVIFLFQSVPVCFYRSTILHDFWSHQSIPLYIAVLICVNNVQTLFCPMLHINHLNMMNLEGTLRKHLHSFFQAFLSKLPYWSLDNISGRNNSFSLTLDLYNSPNFYFSPNSKPLYLPAAAWPRTSHKEEVSTGPCFFLSYHTPPSSSCRFGTKWKMTVLVEVSEMASIICGPLLVFSALYHGTSPDDGWSFPKGPLLILQIPPWQPPYSPSPWQVWCSLTSHNTSQLPSSAHSRDPLAPSSRSFGGWLETSNISRSSVGPGKISACADAVATVLSPQLTIEATPSGLLPTSTLLTSLSKSWGYKLNCPMISFPFSPSVIGRSLWVSAVEQASSKEMKCQFPFLQTTPLYVSCFLAAPDLAEIGRNITKQYRAPCKLSSKKVLSLTSPFIVLHF